MGGWVGVAVIDLGRPAASFKLQLEHVLLLNQWGPLAACTKLTSGPWWSDWRKGRAECQSLITNSDGLLQHLAVQPLSQHFYFWYLVFGTCLVFVRISNLLTTITLLSCTRQNAGMQYHQQEEYWIHGKSDTDFLVRILTTIFWIHKSKTSCETTVTVNTHSHSYKQSQTILI